MGVSGLATTCTSCSSCTVTPLPRSVATLSTQLSPSPPSRWPGPHMQRSSTGWQPAAGEA